MSEVKLYELLVPTRYEDTQTPVRMAHHKEFDKVVVKIAGGLTILKPTTVGYWVDQGKMYIDRTIPVRIACTEQQIRKIAEFAKSHYRQKCIMIYKLSDQVIFI